MNKVILYLEYVEWEQDYIAKDLLHNYPDFSLVPLSRNAYCDLDLWKEEKYQPLIGNNLMVFNYILPYDRIEPVVKYLQPNIIFFMSDEYLDFVEYHDLARDTKLFLRQYHSPTAIYPNIFQIPLGYMKEFMKNAKRFKNSAEVEIEKQSCNRSFSWAFIGALKTDRQEMLNHFTTAQMGNSYISHNLPASNIYEIYSDSVFVPCGRGNINLDCLRLYEASVCGAIPVVVGSEEEISRTFVFDGKTPPWIFAPSWSDAAQYCKQLLDQPDSLNSIQEKNILWWRSVNSDIHNKIKLALD